MRDLELKAGQQGMRGRKGSAHAYNDSRQRKAKRQWVEQAENAASASSPPGGPKAQSECARAPHLGSDGKGCAAGSHPIPALRHEVASALVEHSAVALKKHLSTTSVCCGLPGAVQARRDKENGSQASLGGFR